jgi:hypothetical protein
MIAERHSGVRCYSVEVGDNSPARDNDDFIRLRILPRNKVLLIHTAELGLLPDGEMPQAIMLAYDDTLGSDDTALDRRCDGILRCESTSKHFAEEL